MQEGIAINNLSTKSVFLSIVGKPNVGKSSLLNMAVGCKTSIVSSKPQTTRNRIAGVLTEGDTQIVFTDIPGFLNSKTVLDTYMEREIDDTMSGSDACLHVVEAGVKFSSVDESIISKISDLKVPTVLVINKIDLVKNKSRLIGQMKEYIDKFNYSAIVPISAKTGYGRDTLITEIKKLATPSVFYFPEDQVTDQRDVQIISEIIREKALKFLDKEVPHGIAVYVDSVNERDNVIMDINSSIYCERFNHKGIIIGKNGSMLKKIGSCAREDLEKIFGKKVNLKVWVKIKEDWRNKEGLLRMLGYNV